MYHEHAPHHSGNPQRIGRVCAAGGHASYAVPYRQTTALHTAALRHPARVALALWRGAAVVARLRQRLRCRLRMRRRCQRLDRSLAGARGPHRRHAARRAPRLQMSFQPPNRQGEHQRLSVRAAACLACADPVLRLSPGWRSLSERAGAMKLEAVAACMLALGGTPVASSHLHARGTQGWISDMSVCTAESVGHRSCDQLAGSREQRRRALARRVDARHGAAHVSATMWMFENRHSAVSAHGVWSTLASAGAGCGRAGPWTGRGAGQR